MTQIGYARVSSVGQSLEIQQAALAAAGCQIIRAEKLTGTTTEGRTELQNVLDFLHSGDVLLVTRIDRLARSVRDLASIIHTIKAKGASLRATEQPFDTGNIYGELTINLLGCFAEFENNIRKERQAEGIAKAKQEGRYKGRPVTIDGTLIRRLRADGLGAAAIAKRLGVGRASVYRALQSP